MIFNKQTLFGLASISLLSHVVGGQDVQPTPKENLRYMVELNGKGAAMQNGGIVAVEVVNANMVAVQFPDEEALNKFTRKASDLGIRFEIDPIRMLPTDHHKKASKGLRRAEEIPWGITKTYEEADGTVNIPDQSYYPEAPDIVHSVCVIDSGYWLEHEDLPNDAEVVPGQTNDYAFTDGCEHGSHCAGTIGAIGYNGKGVIGVYPGAPNFKIVKVFGDNCYWSYASGLIAAANACQSAGASILSMSLGGSFFSSFESQEFQRLRDEGVFSIAAAGNGGNTAYSYPASYDSVMSVAATDSNDNIAWFSQKNDQVNIAAPGVNVLSTTSPNQYEFFSGTSMATPHVAGAAMVLWNKVPGASIDEVQDALQQGAIDLGAAGRDNTFGHGLLNYWNSIDLLNPVPTISPAPSGTQPPTSLTFPASLDLTTDRWGFETGWTLTNSNQQLIEQVTAGAYGNDQSYSYDWDLPTDCYDFTITDSYGDGICCGWGQGSYDLSYNGVAVVSGGGEFTSSETTSFGDEGGSFNVFYEGQDYNFGCDWISSQNQFPISSICTYANGDAGFNCPCVCAPFV